MEPRRVAQGGDSPSSTSMRGRCYKVELYGLSRKGVEYQAVVRTMYGWIGKNTNLTLRNLNSGTLQLDDYKAEFKLIKSNYKPKDF
jgi:hypothetical protein